MYMYSSTVYMQVSIHTYVCMYVVIEFPFQEIIASTQVGANRVKDIVEVRMSILPHLGLYG